MRGWLATALAGALTVIAVGSTESAEVLDDSWFLLRVGGAHVGHAHRTVEAARGGEIVTRVTTVMEVRRLGEVLRLTSAEEWTETADGLPLAYHLTRDLGTEETRLNVRVDGGRLTVKKLTGSGTFTDTLGLDGRLLFPEGQRRLHVSRGFQPGDRYSYLVFDPDFESVSLVDVTVVGADSLPAASGGLGGPADSRPAASDDRSRPADSRPAASDSVGLHKLTVASELYEGIEFLTWLDDRGRVWREGIPALGLASQRTTRGAASGVDEIVDIIVETMIETNERIGDPRAVDEALYEIWIEGDDVTTVVPEDRRQAVEAQTDRGVLLRVRRVVPAGGAPDGAAAARAGMDEYLEGNALLQVSDPLIQAAAAEAVGDDALGSWPSTRRIERYVFDTMETAGFGSAFASASEVLQHRTGDCSEYAVLAAAMARAVGIPSRVVSGLVHVDGRFAYHMWIEIWAEDGWYALDPTIGDGSVDATHIKLADSSLAGGVIGGLSLAIMRAMNRLNVNVVEYSDGGRVVRPDAAD